MRNRNYSKGFTLIEVVVATAIFLLFALGVFGGLQLVYKIVYQSRLRILETSILSSQLEIARNLPFDSVGIIGGLPEGLIPHSSIVSRNGIEFDITATVRNIDDPFDGTLGGSPGDTAPADYKLVEMSIVCSSCAQQAPVSLSTRVSPKNLEGDSDGGALFIHVFDANGLDVTGANVHIANTSLDPDLIIDDVTDNDGMLKIVGAPTGTLSYNISATKNGYSSDQTVIPSVENPNPFRPPANVATQMVTQISFAIDQVANLNINTLNSVCGAVPNVPFTLTGSKILGRDPFVYKYSENLTSNASGLRSLVNMEWDKYNVDFSSSNYDVAGTSPIAPLDLLPGADQVFSVILKNHVNNSLLVKVVDSGTGLPLADASVRLYKTGYDQTLPTGWGYMRQTDWSGGSGQLNFTQDNKYFSDSGTIDINSPSGDVTLQRSGQNYALSGWLLSSIMDLGDEVNFGSIIWSPGSQNVNCGQDSLIFQVAASNISNPESWEFTGPDGTDSTYYSISNNILWSGLNGNRYLRYKMFMNTADEDYTPQLFEVAFTYSNSCTPPGQVFFNDTAAGTYILEISRAGYTANSGEIVLSGNMDTLVRLSTSE